MKERIRNIFLMVLFIMFFSCSAQKDGVGSDSEIPDENDENSFIDRDDMANDEAADINETIDSDADYDLDTASDFVIDMGKTNHLIRMKSYKNGYLLAGTIDFPYEPNDSMYLPGYIAYMNKDYSFNWNVLIDKTLFGGMDVADNGNIFICGINANRKSMFLSSFSQSGETLWRKEWTDDSFYILGPGSLNVLKVYGNYLYIGGYSGGWNEDGSMTYNKLYFAKFDLEGNLIWKKTWGAEESHNSIIGISADKEGNLYLTGFTRGSLDGNQNASKAGMCADTIEACSDPFLIKTDSEGNVLWTRQWGSDYPSNHESSRMSIVSDDGKSVFVLSLLQVFSSSKLILRKYDSDGKLLWETIYKEENRDTDYESAYTMLLDKNGKIIVVCTRVEPDLHYSFNNFGNIFAVAFDTEGNLIKEKAVPFLTKIDGSEEEVNIYGLQETDNGFLIMGEDDKTSTLSDDWDTYTFFKKIGYFYLEPASDLTNTEGDKFDRETVESGSEKDDEIIFSHKDENGNLFVAGNTWGKPGGMENKGEKDVFAAKYKSDGTLEWIKNYGSDKWDDLRSGGVDSEGNLIFAGTTWGNFEGNQRLGVGDIFVMKVDGSGNKVWAVTAGSDNDDWVNGVWVDAEGNVFVTGGTYGSIDDNKFSGGYSSDIFVGKWDKDGNKILIEQWGKRIEGFGISGDNQGNIYIAGRVYIDYEDQTVYTGGVPDSIIFKLDDTNLMEHWAKIWGSEEVDSATGIAVDSEGNAYVSGYTFGEMEGNIYLGADCPGGYCSDAYLTKWDSSGKKKWTREFGTENGDRAYTVAIDENDKIYVSGTAGQNRLCGIEPDIFLIKSDTSGNLGEISIWGTAGEEKANSINISNGKILISGSTTGGLDDNTNSGQKDGFVTIIE